MIRRVLCVRGGGGRLVAESKQGGPFSARVSEPLDLLLRSTLRVFYLTHDADGMCADIPGGPLALCDLPLQPRGFVLQTLFVSLFRSSDSGRGRLCH
jgi:hypothetical protein